MTVKKTPAKAVVKGKVNSKPVLPKIGEVGFKFKVDAELIGVENLWDEDDNGDPIKGYEVLVELGDDGVQYTFTLEELRQEMAKYDPKAKKAAQLAKIKEAEAKVVQLKKELESM